MMDDTRHTILIYTPLCVERRHHRRQYLSKPRRTHTLSLSKYIINHALRELLRGHGEIQREILPQIERMKQINTDGPTGITFFFIGVHLLYLCHLR
jgi:hypothetical protein